MDPSTVDHAGCKLAYWSQGDGPPVLFVQGTGVHGAGWMPQVDGLRDRYRCVWFDNRGMGSSQPLAGRLTVAQMADDARAVLDALGIDAAHVVGHSLGGPIALELALTAPDRVKSLGLLCAFARGKDVSRPGARMMWTGIRTRVGTRRMRRHAFLEMVSPAAMLATEDLDALAARLEPVFGHDLADSPPVVTAQLRAMDAWDRSGQLGEVRVPTLVVSASEDMVAPRALGRALADGIPGARYVEIEGAAHGVTIALAERVNGLLAEHFSRVA